MSSQRCPKCGAGLYLDLSDLRAERDSLRSLLEQTTEALREISETVTTDARELARKVMHENNHRVTGTESERIGYLLQTMDRNARLARAALQSAKGGGK